MYIKPEININKFNCENVVATASSVMQQWQEKTENAQARTISYNDLKEIKVEF